MNAERKIRNSQQHWAALRGIPFDSSGYVPEVEYNLWQPLSACAQEGFEKGAGSELRGHMRALHSSSALVVNFFDHWTDRHKTPLLSALGIAPDFQYTLCFEAQFPTGLGGTPPHLDVAITNGNHFAHAIEAKFTEYLKCSTTGKSRFRPAYFPKSGGLWAERGLHACQALAEELRAEELLGCKQRFEYLDPRQLLKHTLGLATQMGKRFSLLYLYYDYYDRVGTGPEAHKREVDRFAERVGDEIKFRTLTYQEVFERLKNSRQANTNYLNYLESKYFPPMV